MKKILLIAIIILSCSSYAEERKTFIIEFYQLPLAVEHGQKIKSQKARNSKSILESQHQSFISVLFKNFNQSKTQILIKHQYFYAFNGIALSLTKDEANFIKSHPEVKSIGLERVYNINTDVGPQWIGSDVVWEGLALDTPGNKGEGIVVGIIDTGINPSHAAFQEISESGTSNQYTHTNPRGTTFGLCNSQTCNNKLIGIYDHTDEGTAGIDSVGHGSHVAGIAAGNTYTTNHLGLTFKVSGVAPRANIISYKACFFSEDAAGGSCSSSDLLAAIDQSTQNQVDVVNYSIGSEIPCSPWGGLDNNGDWCGTFLRGQQASAMLNARNAGVLFVVSAGNNGPGPTTVGYPAIAPWVIAAANTSHSRQLQSSVIDFSGGNSNLENLVGASATEGIGPLKIVHAKDYGNALCGQGEPELKSLCSGSGSDVLTGATNPFAANTFNGDEIVVCDRGSYGRIEKGFNVKQAGAAGYILANTNGQQESIAADNHCLPATHLGNTDGTKLRNWLESGSNHMGTITGQTLVYDEALGDIVNSGSSRGPTTIVYNATNSSQPIKRPQNYMKPNISAPGTSILSATQEGSSGLTSKSGTSMASPHIAGAAALIKAAHPNYTPSQIISSLILTADNTHMLKEDKATKADFSDQGAGRTRVDLAIANSLYFDVSRQDFINANPQNGADVSQLNLPELINNDCYPSCSFTRKIKLLNSFNVVNPVWNVSIEKTNGLNVTVTPSSFDLTSANEVTLSINVDTTANDVIGDWAEAKIVFTVNSSTNSDPLLDTISPSVSKVPLAVFVPAGNYPKIIEKQSTNRHGKFTIDLNDIAAMTDASYSGLGLKAPQTDQIILSIDSNNYPFDDDGAFEQAGSYFSLFDVTTEKLAVIIESNSSGIDAANLYVGQDLNINDTPDEFEIKCQKNGSSQNKRCILENVKPGKYWILLNNKSINGNATITTELTQFDLNDTPRKAAFDSSSNAIKGTGVYIKSAVKVESSTRLDVIYELPWQTSQNNSYYGIIAVGADINSLGKTGIIPIKINATEPTNEKLYSLNNEVAEFLFQTNDKLSNMYVDTGLNATSIRIHTNVLEYQVNFYKTDFDFDPLNIKPDISVLTPDFILQSTSTSSSEIDISNLTPARWYVEVIPSAQQTTEGYITISAEVSYASDGLIQPFQSLWFNPDRSGWGIDLIQTSTFQAVTWYLYNDDGSQPIWMQATGKLTAQNQWVGDLNLITYNGVTPKVDYYGSISIVYTSENTGVISISMPDKTYTEPLRALYTPNTNCPQFNSAEQVDVTGLWYVPEFSGSGYSILATETNETTLFYFYDELGLPVWAAGDRNLNSEHSTMRQASNGFCQDCEALTINLTDVGNFSNTYDSELSGNTSTDIQLISPLSGHWKTNGLSQKLNTNFGCLIN
jgi:subtilisin family serine protease